MPTDQTATTLIDAGMITSRFPGWLAAFVNKPLSGLLGFGKLNQLHRQTVCETNPHKFSEAVLQQLGVSVQVASSDLAKIPQRGPVVVVANHPYGGVDALALMCLLMSRRPDLKVMANYLLSRIPALRSVLIEVDPFGGAEARAANYAGIRRALNWLREGGMLMAFPSGSVAHLNIRQGAVTEQAWSDHIAALVRRTEAAVVPVYISGRNSALFQLAGLLHPKFRTALLGRELVNKKSHRFTVVVGSAWLPRDWSQCGSDQQLTQLLRGRAYAMRHRLADAAPRFTAKPGRWLRPAAPARECRVAAPVEACHLADDIERLPEDALLCRSGALSVYQAEAASVPNILPEIGRLREIAFRSVGEGSGCARDIDHYDVHYRHLFVWNEQERELVGAYRLGLTDRILGAQGPAGLYTASLFDISREFLDRVAPAIELGRSFVRPEYQRSSAPLMLLWKGIGQFLARSPRYRYLIGAVSISGSYTAASKQLMVDFLCRPEYRSPWTELVRAKRPLAGADKGDAELTSLARSLPSLDQLGDVIGDIEPDGKRVPILIRQYLRLGARMLAFSVDPDFQNCLDCFCCFDLLQTQRRDMEKYMGREQTREFLAAHGRWGGSESDAAANAMQSDRDAACSAS